MELPALRKPDVVLIGFHVSLFTMAFADISQKEKVQFARIDNNMDSCYLVIAFQKISVLVTDSIYGD